MSGKTPGQRAYEAWHETGDAGARWPVPWEDQPAGIREAWEAAAAAGAAPAHERAAEAVSELNAVRAERDELRAHSNALAEDLDDAGATIADYRDALTTMQRERDEARAARIVTCDHSPAELGVTVSGAPAMTGAGTEHAVRELLDAGNPGEWQRVADMTAEG